MRNRILLSAGLSASLAINGVVLPAQKPETTQPATADALTVFSAGLENVLVDPKDKGLVKALRMVDDRLRELPRETGETDMPVAALELALELLMGPLSLRAGVIPDANPKAGPPFYAQLSFYTQDMPAAQALAGRYVGALNAAAPHVAAGIKPAPNAPGMQMIAPEGHPIYFGAVDLKRELPNVNAQAAFVIAFNEMKSDPLPTTDLALPDGVAPALAITFDARKFQPLVGMMAKHDAEEHADEVRAQLEMMGLYGPDAINVTAAIGYAKDRGHMALRYVNYAKVAARLKMIPTERLSPADLRRVPGDATYAQVSKVNLNSIGAWLQSLAEHAAAAEGEPAPDPMAMVEAQTGINPQRDIFDHLGQTAGFYMSDTTGGGLLSSIGFIEVKNPDALNQTIMRISGMANQIAQQNAKGYVRIANKRINDQQMTVLTFPGVPIPLEMSLAIADGFLYAGLTPQNVLLAIEQGRAGKNSLIENPRFKESGGDSLNDAMQVQFVDTPRLMRGGYGLMSLAMSALANAVRSPVDPERDPGLIMPPLNELANGAKASLTISRIQGDDLVMTGQFDRSWLVNACGAVGVIGGSTSAWAAAALMAGVTLPAIGKAREAARDTRSMAQLKNISIAATTWAAERDDDVPPSLQAMIDEDYLSEEIIHSPYGPVADAHGDFFFNTAIKKMSRSKYPDQQILAYYRALYKAKGETAVLFYDGHVQVMSGPEFRKLIQSPPNEGVDFKLPDE